MEEIVRPFQAPATAPGFRAPSTSGVNSDTPTCVIGDRQNGQTDTGPFARTDEPESWERWPQLGHLTAGAQEVATAWLDVSSSFEIDPNVCAIWRLRCHSAALAITFSALDSLPMEEGSLYAPMVRVATIQIIVDWQSAATGARSLTLSGVEFAESESPVLTTSAGKDILHVQVTSDGEKYGAVVALNVGEP